MDAIVRVIVAFFAALVGFGLKHILEINEAHRLYANEKLIFSIATVLFLRFLTGSASQMWVEHVKPSIGAKPSILNLFFFEADIAFLVLYGILMSFMCYANNVPEFFQWGMALPVASLASSAILIAIDRVAGYPGKADWTYWIFINIAQLIVFGCAFSNASVDNVEQFYLLTRVLALSSIILLVDLALQLQRVRETLP